MSDDPKSAVHRTLSSRSKPHPTVPYRPARVSPEQSVRRLEEQYRVAATRRSVRAFSSEPVPEEAIVTAIRIAGTAPSGAHRQPWYFVAVGDPELKRRIREAAEKEEREFYERRATPEWLDALAPLGTDFIKSHLTDAPWVIVVFRRDYELLPDGRKLKGYYLAESVGIATGFLISALHQAGLATLTHTPAPMNFLRDLCGRPASDKPYLLLPVGYPSSDCEVPDLARKAFEEIGELR
ncbi:MAG TPA: nitroreductase family protein [Polyangiaceae bacterium]|nr:nitroreductase family protein [Polyangiaceae bacterium]